MRLTYTYLTRYPKVFQSLTGLRVREFERLLDDVLALYQAEEIKRLSRPDRQRAIGGGDKCDLAETEQLLVTVIWLRTYSVHLVLGFLFGVSGVTVGRLLGRWVPVLGQAGRDTMRLPDPGKKRRRTLDALLADTPELAVIIDTFEQPVQRPRQRAEADGYYSGKKKRHTLKSQIAIDEHTGTIADVAESVPGPTADLTVLKDSGLMQRLPGGIGGLGDVAYNTAFAKRRIKVEHTIGRVRRYQAVSQTDRHHRRNHTARVVAIAGLVNRQITSRLPC